MNIHVGKIIVFHLRILVGLLREWREGVQGHEELFPHFLVHYLDATFFFLLCIIAVYKVLYHVLIFKGNRSLDSCFKET